MRKRRFDDRMPAEVAAHGNWEPSAIVKAARQNVAAEEALVNMIRPSTEAAVHAQPYCRVTHDVSMVDSFRL